jgi:hypothetical protein
MIDKQAKLEQPGSVEEEQEKAEEREIMTSWKKMPTRSGVRFQTARFCTFSDRR